MDNSIIINKIERIRRCIARIETKCPESVEALASDLDAQDIVSVNLERAIQSSVDIATHIIASMEISAPDTMGEVFVVLQKRDVISSSVAERMIKSVGFRNIVVHAYHEIDWAVVFAIITKNINDFKDYIRQIAAFCGIE